MPKSLNITNQRFGHLTAIEKAKSRNGKTYWKCVCDCGIEKEIQTSHLTSGATTTCGDKECQYHKPFSHEATEIKCAICSEKFIPNSHNRKYCYTCCPEGSGSKIGGRYKLRAIKHMLVQYKGGKCEKCGYSACEGALQFHHVDPFIKEFNISHVNLNDTITMNDLYKEIDKCYLLCANCHFEQHYLDDIDLEE